VHGSKQKEATATSLIKDMTKRINVMATQHYAYFCTGKRSRFSPLQNDE